MKAGSKFGKQMAHKPGAEVVPKVNGSAPISFSARRYASKGPRRLFLPDQSLMAPVLDSQKARARTLLGLI